MNGPLSCDRHVAVSASNYICTVIFSFNSVEFAFHEMSGKNFLNELSAPLDNWLVSAGTIC